MNKNSVSKWWWRKSSSTTTREENPSSLINDNHDLSSMIVNHGADENASIFTLYSYNESILSPSSILVHHGTTRSEHSEVASNASILSKPWVSKGLIMQQENESLLNTNEPKTITIETEEEEDNNDDEAPDIIIYSKDSSSDGILNSSLQPSPITATDLPQTTNKRRPSLVDYLMNKKPLHGKLKAGLVGRFVKNKNFNNEITTTDVTLSLRNNDIC
ncbi:uncharacterized protein BX663DRAFT_561900 [Cokeromyces recurvatus]|uniref:uncharacterized protein n=1 Tax=Cokeromyces recurvatus TaxID=90255 RepID=UPI00221FFC84|nr:uncharacterized protein BX663DRAFT_561900 [Cokeromyces recurvatus]KAI7901845.1 hypothetical protein BX663DRAFT_561900 [Cokeromyces recurvatus]